MATITLKILADRLDNLSGCMDDEAWQLVALKIGEGQMKRRIFQDGKATNLTTLGPYRSASHAAYRRSKGRQTGKKDLFLEGDLNRALTVGTNKGDIVLGLSTKKANLIANGQEAQVGKKIFSVSKPTLKKIQNAAIREYRACLQKSYRK